jgi:hypothetical protein
MALTLQELQARMAKAQAAVNGTPISAPPAPSVDTRFDPLGELRSLARLKQELHWDGTVERAMTILGLGSAWSKPGVNWIPPWVSSGLEFKAWDNKMAAERGDPPIWK